MDSDQLALHWMEHSRVFSEAIGKLRTKTTYTDATLACEGNFYPVHKFVLSTCSQYFNAIFEWTPCINPVVVINNVTSKELESLLDFMYTGEASVKEAVIPDVMRAAECLRIRGLSIIDEDVGKSNLKHKLKSDSKGPGRKRRRTSGPKSKVSSQTRNRIPSTSRSSESNTHSSSSPPVLAANSNNEGHINHAENHGLDLTPTHKAKKHSSESHHYDSTLTHMSSQNNAVPSALQSTLPSPQPHLTIQPVQQSLQPTSNKIINQHSKRSPSHALISSHSNVLDLPSHEPISDVSMHSAVNVIKSGKMELEETKPHVSKAHVGQTSEIPELLNSLGEMRHEFDTKPESADEVATLHAAESNQSMYEFTEELPSASAAASKQIRFKKGPAASSSSKKVEQNSTEDDPALKCRFCGKQCQKKDSLTRHMRTHSKEPFTCNQCPFTSKTYRACLQHRKKEHGNIHKCPMCDFKVSRYDNLRRHIASHEKAHRCSECKFITANPKNLEKHMKNKHEKK